jgi:hypothetical protein
MNLNKWWTVLGNPANNGIPFYTGDPNMICLAWYVCLSSCVILAIVSNRHPLWRAYRYHSLPLCCSHSSHGSHKTSLPPSISTPGYWRELCVEACQDPDNINRLASSLVERHTPYQEDMRAEPGRLNKSGRFRNRPTPQSPLHTEKLFILHYKLWGLGDGPTYCCKIN